MEQQTKNDLRINGIGSSVGGNFNSVQINGKGEINGDVNCKDLHVNGLCSFNGHIHAELFKISGKSDIKGDLFSKDATIDGKLDIDGSVEVANIQNHGMLGVTGEISSEKFNSNGGFKVGGLLNAGRIQIVIYAPCSAKELGGEDIDIRVGRSSGLREFIGSFFSGWPLKTSFTTDTIEGDHIYLENTVAKVVRGHDVKIGHGCKIDLVEYKNSFQKDDDPGIKINESRKI